MEEKNVQELSPDELNMVAGGADGGSQINLQVIIHALRVYPGAEFLDRMMKNESKRAAKEWIIANLPAYLAPRYPGYTLEQIQNVVSQYAVQGINSVV